MLRELKFKYSFLLMWKSKKNIIVNLLWLISFALFTLMTSLAVFLGITGNNEITTLIIVYISLSSFHIFYTLLKLQKDVDTKHILLKISSGIKLTDYIWAIIIPHILYSGIFFGSLIIETSIIHQKSAIYWNSVYLFCFFMNILLVSLSVFLMAWSKNMNMAYLCLIIINGIAISNAATLSGNHLLIWFIPRFKNKIEILPYILFCLSGLLFVIILLLNCFITKRFRFSNWTDINQEVVRLNSVQNRMNEYIKRIMKF